MRSATIEEQYRRFLLLLSAFILVGTLAELWFEEHFESAMQLVPSVLCGLGLIALLPAWLTPGKRSLQILRVVMALILLGGLFGIYEHIAHNLAFELEIRPNATASEVWGEALHGASPLLAPGILSLAGLLALAATYRHPSFQNNRS